MYIEITSDLCDFVSCIKSNFLVIATLDSFGHSFILPPMPTLSAYACAADQAHAMITRRVGT